MRGDLGGPAPTGADGYRRVRADLLDQALDRAGPAQLLDDGTDMWSAVGVLDDDGLSELLASAAFLREARTFPELPPGGLVQLRAAIAARRALGARRQRSVLRAAAGATAAAAILVVGVVVGSVIQKAPAPIVKSPPAQVQLRTVVDLISSARAALASRQPEAAASLLNEAQQVVTAVATHAATTPGPDGTGDLVHQVAKDQVVIADLQRQVSQLTQSPTSDGATTTTVPVNSISVIASVSPTDPAVVTMPSVTTTDAPPTTLDSPTTTTGTAPDTVATTTANTGVPPASGPGTTTPPTDVTTTTTVPDTTTTSTTVDGGLSGKSVGLTAPGTSDPAIGTTVSSSPPTSGAGPTATSRPAGTSRSPGTGPVTTTVPPVATATTTASPPGSSTAGSSTPGSSTAGSHAPIGG